MKKYKINNFIEKWAATAFTALMFLLFPVFLTDGYFNIRHDKLNLFYALSGVLLITTATGFIIFDEKEKTAPLNREHLKNCFSVTDWSVIAFSLMAVIGTVFSKYRMDALTGIQGRNNGLVLLLFYAAVYFLISRNYSGKRVVPLIFCAVSAGVALLAVWNQFYWDPFNIYDELSTDQYNKFLSTIGNRNMLSAFLCLSFPLCFTLFVHSDNVSDSVITAVCTALNFCGVICSDSDGSILGVGVFLIVSFLINIVYVKRLARFFFMSGAAVLFCKLCRLVSLTNEDYSMGFGKIQDTFIYGNAYMAGVALILISVLLYFIGEKKTKTFPKYVRVVFMGIFAAALILIFCAVWHYSVMDTSTKLSGLYKYLRFDDSWGTHRGFMWIRSVYAFCDMNIFQKLFGSGPDTYRSVMDAFGYTAELKAFKHETTDAAHNAYLNYLVTLGAFGLVSYMTAVFTVIKRAFRAKTDRYTFAFAAAVFCYSVQALVNIEQPITTPLFILMAALTENGIRNCSRG